MPKIGTLQGFFIEFIGGIFLMVTAYTSAHKGHSPATSGLAGTKFSTSLICNPLQLAVH